MEGPPLVPQQWTEHLGFYRADGVTPYLTDDLPMVRSARGESGRHEQLVVRNARVPEGRLLQCSWQPIQGEAGTRGGLVVFTDVTELQRLQAEQAAQFDQLRETQRRADRGPASRPRGQLGDGPAHRVGCGGPMKCWCCSASRVSNCVPRIDEPLRWVHPDDVAMVEHARELALRSGEIVNIEYRMVKPDGTTGWIHGIVEARRNGQNEPVWLGGVVQDITERKQAEADLVLLRKAVARVNDIVLITEASPIDPPGPRIVFVNEAFERLTGYTAQEAIGNTPRMLQGPENRSRGARSASARPCCRASRCARN